MLLVLLVVTRVCGEVAIRVGQPALVGELLGGVGLGLVVARFAGVFPVLSRLPDDAVFSAVTDLGVFFMMIGAGVPALALGVDRRAALAVGVAMSSRGAVELVVADVAKDAGLFDMPGVSSPIVDHLFSAVVVVAVITTVLVPVGLRLIYRGVDPVSGSDASSSRQDAASA